MSLGQSNSTLTIGGGIPPDVTPRLKITSNLFLSGSFTAMCWANHTGGSGDAYSDLITISDTSDVIGMTLHDPGSGRVFSMGDLNSDIDGNRVIPDNEWHHYTIVVGVGTLSVGTVACLGYLDGALHISGTLVNPAIPTFAALFNSRASDTDAGACFIGNMAGVKIWSGVCLTGADIQREMWTYMPQKRDGLWACSPLTGLDTRTHNYLGNAGLDWTTQSNWFSEGTNNPSGVSWDTPLAFRDQSVFIQPASAALTGTAASGMTEANVIAGGKTIILTLTGDTWIVN